MDSSAVTIEQFCVAHQICRATFYNLQKRGQAPAVMKIGARTLVSNEAAAEWRRRMEAHSIEPVAA